MGNQKPLEPIPNTKFFEGCERESCPDMCIGCSRVFEQKTNILYSEDTNADQEVDRVCRAYLSPKAKWRKHISQVIEKFMKGKKIPVTLHFNPCNLATHVIHTEMHLHSDGKVRVGQQKQSHKKKTK
jgi:hypothetical protein